MTKDETLLVFTLVVSSVSLSRYWDRLIDFLDRYLWACAQRIQTGIRKQKGEFVVTFSCRVKKKKGFTREQ